MGQTVMVLVNAAAPKLKEHDASQLFIALISVKTIFLEITLEIS